MAKKPGSLWVEGETLRFVASDGSEWRYSGSLVGSQPAATEGSLWVESNGLHYISATNKEYLVAGTTQGTHAEATEGSIWVEGDFLHWIETSGGRESRGNSPTEIGP